METGASPDSPTPTALPYLRRFVRKRSVRERCELCDVELAAEHSHLLDLSTRQLACACEACAILFSGQAVTRYRRVPRRPRFLPDFRLTDETWGALQLPINLAFFVNSTPEGRVIVLYPSPAGATESLLTLEAWQDLVAENPVLASFEPDVEALLIHRKGAARECYRAGIDECYKLVGLIRTHWRGLSGGAEAWEAIGRFFADLKRKSS